MKFAFFYILIVGSLAYYIDFYNVKPILVIANYFMQ